MNSFKDLIIKHVDMMDFKYSYHTYEKSHPKVDPNIAAKFLIEGVTRDILLEAVCDKDEAIISTLKSAELSQDERFKLISNIHNKRLTIDLISENKLSLKERRLLLSKNLNSNFAYAYVNHIHELTDDEEKYLVKCLAQNPSIANDLFRFGGYEKFSKAGLIKLKQGIFKDSTQAKRYISYKPDAADRKEAFQSIIKTAKGAYEFFKDGKPTRAEMTQILEKLALSRTYLPRIVSNYINNHDKKIMAQTIFAAGDLHQAKIMLDNCNYDYDRNIIQLLEPLKMAITLVKAGTQNGI